MSPPCSRLAILATLLQTLAISEAAFPKRRGLLQPLANPAESFLDGVKSLNTSGASDFPLRFASNNDYSLPQKSINPIERAGDVHEKKSTFLYKPAPNGAPFYPTGELGDAKAAADVQAMQRDVGPELESADEDDEHAKTMLAQYNNLTTLEDYTLLYPNNWENILPRGVDPGALTNYTQDLFFSMERLSNSPYQVRRLDPSSDTLAFPVDDDTAMNVTGTTLDDLFGQGRIFYADYTDQKDLPKTSVYGAACDAYFYIDRSSGDFMPLAIRTNVGANLIYTPADEFDDWMLAKIMLNANDFWFAQWHHFASTHDVTQIAYMAAVRTLSEDHPIMAILNRLMFEIFGIPPLGDTLLFNKGSAVDQLFPYPGSAAIEYAGELYNTGGWGRFQSNYFEADLERRGLLNSKIGPPLKNMPFHEDASTIFSSIHTFMAAMVDSYYSADFAVVSDQEIQNWVEEAQGPAKAIDFPLIFSKEDLINVMTHIAHLVSTSHQATNTNELLEISSTLPFHTPALYQEIPTKKGSENAADYLPPFEKVLTQMSLGAVFARPKLVGTDRTMIHMFDDPIMLSRMNQQTQDAAALFQSEMEAFSAVVSARTFDDEGLSQGMPFVWRALDPNVAPYSITT